VTEGLVREYVHDLRLILNDDPKAPRFIETVPRRGYRFLGGVAIRDGTDAGPNLAGEAAGRPVLLVNPFEDLSGSTRSGRLAHGLTDDLLTDLARFPDLVVVRGAEQEPDHATAWSSWKPDYRLEGGVQISDDVVRLNVRMLRLSDGRYIWTERYDQTLEYSFALQSNLTTQIVSTVGSLYGPLAHSERVRLRARPPMSLETYELYRLAFDLELTFDRASVMQARTLIERAVELDPDFARGWLVVGWIAWQLAMEKWDSDPEAWRRRMCESYCKAAALDPRDPTVLMELSAARAIMGDEIGAREALERSLDLGGHHAETLISCSNYVASILDDPERAVAILDDALTMLPELSSFHQFTVLRVAFFAGDMERAAHAGALSVDFLPTRLFRALALSELGREAEAQEARRRLLQRVPRFISTDYLSDHPITGPKVRERFLAACDRLELPRGQAH
jgi:TolB-like protein